MFNIKLQKMHFSDNLRLPIRTSHHTFLESSLPELTKNLHYVFSTRRSQIPIFLGSSSRTNIQVSTIFSYIEKTYTLESQLIVRVGIIGGLDIVIIINNRGSRNELQRQGSSIVECFFGKRGWLLIQKSRLFQDFQKVIGGLVR